MDNPPEKAADVHPEVMELKRLIDEMAGRDIDLFRLIYTSADIAAEAAELAVSTQPIGVRTVTQATSSIDGTGTTGPQ